MKLGRDLCGQRKPQPITMNEWKVCILMLGHEGKHQNKDGSEW